MTHPPIPAKPRHAIPLIGLVGGIASGKSAVGSVLETFGGITLSADAIVHRLLETREVLAELVHAFGVEILTLEGKVDRKQLAMMIFAEDELATEARRRLEGILHPRVRIEIEQRVAEVRAAHTHRFIVLDAPLLLEAGYQSLCDAILYIDTPDHVRNKRARERGWTEDELRRREATQWPLARKAREADYIVQGSESLEKLHEQIESLIQILFQESSGLVK